MIPISTLDGNAAIGEHTEILQDIHLKTKNIAVYQRVIAPLKEELTKVSQRAIEFRANGSVEEITFSLGTYFAKELPGQLNFMKDILNLLGLFEKVTKASFFRMSLAKIRITMCPRFHADNNVLRMLCTYIGPGTVWLPDYAVDRDAYIAGKGNQKISTDENLVQQVKTGDVVILKGALYPEATPILHRSPNIGENDTERILLSIDINQSLCLPKKDS